MSMILATDEVTVDFPGTRALERVSIEVRAEEVVAVVGANGSGKTTLLSVLCGLRQPSEGTLVGGSGPVTFRSPIDALRAGITLVPQEPQLAGTLSCWENVVLGRPARRGFVLSRARRARARAAVQEALPLIDPDQPADALRKADRAILSLLAALERRPRILALDEPTAVLGEQSVSIVGAAVSRVRENGGAVVLVSHRLRDIVELATRLVVLVDGRVTYDGSAENLTADDLVAKLMHGRESDEHRIAPEPLAVLGERGRVLLRAERVRAVDGLELETLEVRAGDILGVAGLAGSGRSRLLRALGGATRLSDGAITFEGTSVAGRGVRAARRLGIAYVPEDRASEGIFPPLSVSSNLAVEALVARRALLSRSSAGAERSLATALLDRFAIRAPSLQAPVTALSGGNQQRVVLARTLSPGPELLLADEPTQGVDSIGRASIHETLRAFAGSGGAVVLVSSDFDEMIELSTRMVVMRDGRMLGELPPERTDYRSLVALASGADAVLESAA